MTRFLQRAHLNAELSLRTRRPPAEYVSLLSKSEQEFRSYIHSLEGDPVFQKLLREGAIAKVRLRGRIPREKYEEFMDRQLVQFLRDYRITEHPDWERDFLSPHALSQAVELARKYHVPAGILVRQLRYLKTSSAGPASQRLSVNAFEAHDGNGHEYLEMPATEDSVAASGLVDLTEIIERTRLFVTRYEVSEQEFLDLILSGTATAASLTAQFGCSLREAEELLEDADRVYLAESWDSAGQIAASPARTTASYREPVAQVQVIEGRLAVQFRHDSVYAQRYRIQREVADDPSESTSLESTSLESTSSKAASHQLPDDPLPVRDLLLRARYINQRLSALSRLIVVVCEWQIAYLADGDTKKLKPLAQADVARQLGEHPSTVSRLIRDKLIETPHGRTPLSFLCQSKTEVVARLVAAHPHLTDQEMVTRLREEHECYIARRTVAYHRAKRLRRNKRRNESSPATARANATAAKLTRQT